MTYPGSGTSCQVNANISECSLLVTLIPHFTWLSLFITILPWILGGVIVFANINTFSDVWGNITLIKNCLGVKEGGKSLVENILFFIGLIFFPVTIFLTLGFFQYKLDVMKRNKKLGVGSTQENQKQKLC